MITGYSKLFGAVLEAAQPLDIRLSHIVDKIITDVGDSHGDSRWSADDHHVSHHHDRYDNDDSDTLDDHYGASVDDKSTTAKVVVQCTNGQSFTGELFDDMLGWCMLSSTAMLCYGSCMTYTLLFIVIYIFLNPHHLYTIHLI